MNAIHIAVAVFLNSLWEDALLALAVWALLRNVRVNASTRYFSWLVTLIAAILLPVLTTVPLTKGHPTARPATQTQVARNTAPVVPRTVAAHASVQRSQHIATNTGPIVVTPAIAPSNAIRLPSRLHLSMPIWLAEALFALWAAVALLIALRLGWDLYRLERLKREALPLPFELRDQMARWVEAAYGPARQVRICVSDKIEVPVAVGLFDSMILLPVHLLQQLSAGEIDRISLHELAHLRRADDWTNSLQRIAQIIFFFNPAIRFIGAQLDLEREVACDDWVLELTGEIRPYATCLHKMAELTAWPHQALAAPGVFATRKGISVRIERLLNKHRNSRVNVGYMVPASVFIALAALFVVANVVTPVIAYTPEGAIITKPPTVAQALHGAKRIVARLPIVAWPIVHLRPAAQPPPKTSVRTVVHTIYHTRTVYVRNGATQRVVQPNPKPNPNPNVNPNPNPHPHVHLAQRVAVSVPAIDVSVPAIHVNVPATHVDVPGIHVHVPAIHVAPAIDSLTKAQLSPYCHCSKPAYSGPFCSGCDLTNVDWSGKDLSGRNFTGSNFAHARLAGSNLSHAQLSGVDFEGADLRDANFTGANLTGCDLSGADIRGARFEGAHISGCEGVKPRGLDQAQLRVWLAGCSGCDFAGADFRSMDLRGVRVSGDDFSRADFRGADLSGASFSGADFSHSLLAGARVRGTRFTGCDFSRTDLRNVDLSEAELTGSDLSSAIMR
ncbi:MAG: pentapeptide repeat-containing protein [Candidatus Eremiobacteraeota bacterium]|nr:pentapeptide repeat-containing protein [Candidatus Eremiobacteraeota bacterium]